MHVRSSQFSDLMRAGKRVRERERERVGGREWEKGREREVYM